MTRYSERDAGRDKIEDKRVEWLVNSKLVYSLLSEIFCFLKLKAGVLVDGKVASFS